MSKLKQFLLSKEFRNFFIGGITAFALDFSILYFLTNILNWRAELFDLIVIPNIISASISIIYNFFFQKHIVFKGSSSKVEKQFGKFVLVQLSNLILFSGILFGLLVNLFISLLLSKVITTAVQMFYSFLLYKFFVFKKNN